MNEVFDPTDISRFGSEASRLKNSHSQISPERSLAKLRRIQHQVVTVNDLASIAALSNINQEHAAILQALTIKKPTLPTQLTLL